jgi:hypothetical protein
MKKLAIILLVVTATTMIFTACGKYEEGPAFSLLTKKARIVGSWTLTEVTNNGAIQDISQYSMSPTFEKDGTGKYTVSFLLLGTNYSYTGDLEWEFNDTKESLRSRMKNEDGVFESWNEATILKLTNSECWLSSVDTTDGVVYTSISKYTKD